MRKIKEFITSIAILTALTAGLTGCGSNNNSTSATTTASQSAQSAAANTNEYTGEVTVVKAATGGSLAPYMITNDDGTLTGYDIEVFNEIFNRLPQYELEWTITSDAITGVQAGLYDVTVNNWAYRAERAEVLYYSYPYKITDKVFVQRIDDEDLTGLGDAAQRGYKIELGGSGPIDNAIENYNKEHGTNLEVILTEAETLVKYQHIADGITDYALDDGPIVRVWLRDFGLDDQLKAVSLSDTDLAEILPSVYTYFLFTKDERGYEIREAVDGVLKEMYEDGTLLELAHTYLNSEAIPSADAFNETLN